MITRNERMSDYKRLEELRGSRLLVYITSDRENAASNIGPDVIAPLVNHLDIIGDVDKISLLLYSNGGSTLAAWSIVNLIRSFCKDFEVIIPFRCQSAATLIGLGSNRMVMTKQATLGPIDPSTNGFMNPQINFNGQVSRIPVSVEHVNGYLDMAKEDFRITKDEDLTDIFLKLTDNIHPLSLGNVFRSKFQIKMLAEKLLQFHSIDKQNISKVINFLCSDSGSHDYTINRREAKDELGLNVEKPNDELYSIIKAIYQSIEAEMELRNSFNLDLLMATKSALKYSLRRALVESVDGGTDVFLTEGAMAKQILSNGQSTFQDIRTFTGWRHEI